MLCHNIQTRHVGEETGTLLRRCVGSFRFHKLGHTYTNDYLDSASKR